MNSHNPPHQLSNKLSVKCRAVAATFRLGFANFTRGTSPTMLVTSHIIPEILRMITYVLIARVIGGDTAQQYAIPGVIVLATTRMTISETSGLPVDDVWNKTLGSNVTGTLSPATQYLIRALPLAAVAILDQKGAQNLFNASAANGYAGALGQVILLRNTPVRIIGIVDTSSQSRFEVGNNISVYMPYTAAMNRLLGRSSVSSIILRISDSANPAVAEDAITRILTRRHGSQDFSLFNSDSLRKAISQSVQVFSILISSIAVISLVVGGIGVMNIMLVSVTERTQEIGIRMAVGARQGDIMMQFLIEALMLCLLGGAIGVGLAYGFGWVMNNTGSATPSGGEQAAFKLVYSTASTIAAVICASGIGLLFGFLPARNAARLDPVEALSRE